MGDAVLPRAAGDHHQVIVDNERGCRETPASVARTRCKSLRPPVAAAVVACLLLIGSACDNPTAADTTPTRSSGDDAKSSAAASAPSPDVPEMASTGSIRCGAPSAPLDVDPDGDRIEADVPGSNGTRMFRRARPFPIPLTTRAGRVDP